MQNVSLEDIAEKAGYHRTTVSRALKNDPRLSKATIDKIQKIAQQMGFRVNPFISSMMTQRANKIRLSHAGTIAVILPKKEEEIDTLHYIGQQSIRGILGRARERGFTCDTFDLSDKNLNLNRIGHILKARGISGLCFAPMIKPDNHLSMDWENIAVSAVGHSIKSPPLSRSCHHQYHGMIIALEAIRNLGYKRIGFSLSPGVSKRVDDAWLSAFLKIRYYQPDIHMDIAMPDQHNPQEIKDWIHRESLQIILSDSSYYTKYIQEAGLSVPGDVAYASLAWDPKDTRCAGINQHSDQVGAAGIDLLIAQLQRNERGLPKHPRTIMVEGSWMDGETAPEHTINKDR